jgi:hypothetical protein
VTSAVVPVSEQRLVEFLQAAKDQEQVTPEQAALDIVRRILASDTIEDVLAGTPAIHARDVVGDVLTITGYSFNESGFSEAGPGFYMLIECVDGNGEPFKVTCGALNVMAQLFRLGQLQAFPLAARLTEAENATKAGYRPMWLEAVTPRGAAPAPEGASGGDF